MAKDWSEKMARCSESIRTAASIYCPVTTNARLADGFRFVRARSANLIPKQLHAQAVATKNNIMSSRSRTAMKGSLGGDRNPADGLINRQASPINSLRVRSITYENQEAGL